MRAIDLLHLGREKVICCWKAGSVLIDPGPESCLDTLLAALGGERPSAILLTHIHFDHAGATGALLRRWPELPVYVHERGARHLADPERLVASATRLYGEEDMERLWGEVVPVPGGEPARARRGGERGVEGAFRVEYTPGHASHHVSYLHEDVGLGVRRRRRRRADPAVRARPGARRRRRTSTSRRGSARSTRSPAWSPSRSR